MGHIERRQKEKENVRNSILQAALDIAMSDGWNSVTIRKIADAIEYTPPIIYEYFKNKEDLLNELALMGHRMLRKGFDVAREKESDPRKILILFSLSHWDFAFEHKELYQLMFSLDKPFPNEEIDLFIHRVQDLFLELTEDKDFAKELMFNWLCLLRGFIYNIKQMGVPPELDGIDPKELFRKAIGRFISNI
ncbi:MAG: TetR/AcrR family transcriptional regulator [Mangrovibacterium sp.]